jgi:hypothetical protein
VTWSETHLAGPFDLRTAPFAGGLFLGDYMGLAATPDAWLALHARTTGNAFDPTNVYLARVPRAIAGAAYGPLEAKGTRVEPDFERRVAAALTRAMSRRPGGKTPAEDSPATE